MEKCQLCGKFLSPKQKGVLMYRRFICGYVMDKFSMLEKLEYVHKKCENKIMI